VPRTLQAAQPHGTRSEDHVLQTADRSSYTNTSGIPDPDAISNIAVDFSPKCAWPGSPFRVFLQGSFAEDWHQQTDLEYGIIFEGHIVKAVLDEIESSQIGTRQYVLQCVVPQINKAVGHVSITLALWGLDGKPLIQPMLLGFFQYKPNGVSSRM
jgi:hypothetical protein